MNREQTKYRNQGFSLVELLVAISILAIITVPLLHSFVTATRTNTKARLTLYATNVSQDIMEGFKAYGTQSLLGQFTFSKDAGNTTDTDLASANAFSIMSLKHGAVAEVKSETSADKVDVPSIQATPIMGQVEDADHNLVDAVTGYQYTVDEKNTYYFTIEDIETESHKFDAVVTMNASGYQKADKSGYNDTPIATIGNVSNKNSAVYVQQTAADISHLFIARTDTYTSVTDETKFMETLINAQQLNKTITIQISKTTGDKIKVTRQTTYTCSPNVVNLPDDSYTTSEQTIFDNYATGDELHSVYLFYEGYHSNSNVTHDNIVIRNTDNVPVTVYVVKQKDDNVNPYMTNLKLEETPGLTKAVTSICTNLESAGNNRYNPLDYIGSAGYDTDLIMNKLDKEQESNRMYTVTVDVYEAPAAPGEARYQNKVASFDGSRTE